MIKPEEMTMAENEKENMELLSVEEAAAYLKFSTNYIYILARQNKIPHVSFGRHILFRKTDLYNWLGTMVEPSSFVVNK